MSISEKSLAETALLVMTPHLTDLANLKVSLQTLIDRHPFLNDDEFITVTNAASFSREFKAIYNLQMKEAIWRKIE